MQNNKSHMRPKISELLGYFTRLYNSGASYRVPRKVPRKAPSVMLCFFTTIFIYFRAPTDYKIFQKCIQFNACWDIRDNGATFSPNHVLKLSEPGKGIGQFPL